jgi:hypothetical protein
MRRVQTFPFRAGELPGRFIALCERARLCTYRPSRTPEIDTKV